MTVFSPTDRTVSAGRAGPIDLPARELALTVHRGEHDDIDLTYGALGAHLAEHALVVDGPVHETYLVGPRDTASHDTDNRAAWRTEIGWPVFTTAT
ncbi:GyrI-like domain-containing protein [Pseudonocardia broussonetiae]|uniref:GyrI-like domain-containing protein n=1 Tax=Pseudonocardia broussonetiae TaxID=2736640 RepID=UPI001F035477|nr:GyrI-like domain-containing protein [Pseudonocardia broussonetiae]